MCYVKRWFAYTVNILMLGIFLTRGNLAFGAVEDLTRQEALICPSPQSLPALRAERGAEAAGGKANSNKAAFDEPANTKTTLSQKPEKGLKGSAGSEAAKESSILDKHAPHNSSLRIPRPALPLSPNRVIVPQPAPGAKRNSEGSRSPGSSSVQFNSQLSPDQKLIPSGNTLTSQPIIDQQTKAQDLPKDNYPAIGQMEVLTFGQPNPTLGVEERLSRIEEMIFRQSFPKESLFDRTQRLNRTLFGDSPRSSETQGDEVQMARGTEVQSSGSGWEDYFEEIARQRENQRLVSQDELAKFALELINYERENLGHPPLLPDELAGKIAKEHVDDLAQRNVISHMDGKGRNPDERYTLASGTNALTESLVSIKSDGAQSGKFTRALAAHILRILMARQDDRDAIFSPDATKFGMAVDRAMDRQKIIACVEVITEHGVMQPVPREIGVGEKIEIKGAILNPYKFERVTVAWEGLNTGLASTPDESEEALPYFPPLDYVAFATRSEHDFSKAMGALRTVGVIAAIAGGMFMPPVALAVPIIAVSGGVGEPKPASDIPVRGRVKLQGSTFYGKIPISNNGKEGLYYVTVWASMAGSGKLVPISRRTLVGKLDVPTTSQLKSKANDVVNKTEAKKGNSK